MRELIARKEQETNTEEAELKKRGLDDEIQEIEELLAGKVEEVEWYDNEILKLEGSEDEGDKDKAARFMDIVREEEGLMVSLSYQLNGLKEDLMALEALTEALNDEEKEELARLESSESLEKVVGMLPDIDVFELNSDDSRPLEMKMSSYKDIALRLIERIKNFGPKIKNLQGYIDRFHAIPESDWDSSHSSDLHKNILRLEEEVDDEGSSIRELYDWRNKKFVGDDGREFRWPSGELGRFQRMLDDADKAMGKLTDVSTLLESGEDDISKKLLQADRDAILDRLNLEKDELKSRIEKIDRAQKHVEERYNHPELQDSLREMEEIARELREVSKDHDRSGIGHNTVGSRMW